MDFVTVQRGSAAEPWFRSKSRRADPALGDPSSVAVTPRASTLGDAPRSFSSPSRRAVRLSATHRFVAVTPRGFDSGRPCLAVTLRSRPGVSRVTPRGRDAARSANAFRCGWTATCPGRPRPRVAGSRARGRGKCPRRPCVAATCAVPAQRESSACDHESLGVSARAPRVARSVRSATTCRDSEALRHGDTLRCQRGHAGARRRATSRRPRAEKSRRVAPLALLEGY